MRTSLLSLTLLLTAPAWGEPATVSSVKSYAGRDGQRVEVATLQPLSQAQGLVRVSGADSLVDGVVLGGAFEVRGSGERAFVTTLAGASFELLRLGEGRLTLTLPDRPTFTAKFLEGGSPALGQELVATHQLQQHTGRLGLVQRKPFPHLEKKYQGKADAALAELNQACHTQASFRFEWGRFPDQVLEEKDVWALCAPLVAAARKACPAVQTYACGFGSALDLVKSDAELAFTTTLSGNEEGPRFLAGRLEKAP